MINRATERFPRPRRWAWPLITLFVGIEAAAKWINPLFHPKGTYAGHYRFTDIEFATILTIAWLALFAITLSPIHLRRGRATKLGTVLSVFLLTGAVCDQTFTYWSVWFGHVWCGVHAFSIRTTEADPELIYKHRPGITWTGQKTPECYRIDFRTDEQGFRNPPGIRQANLVFIGDSVTEAGEVPEGQTFVRRAESMVGERAVNLGVFCYGPQQELVVLKRYGLKYRPTVVIWQVTEWNDLEDAERFAQGIVDARRVLPWKTFYENHSLVVKLIAKLFPPRRRNVVDFELTGGSIERRVIWPFVNTVPACPTGLAETRRILSEAHRLCRAQGAEFVVVCVPAQQRVLAPFIRTKDAREEARYRPASGSDVPNDVTHALAAICNDLGCAFIDVTPALRRRATEDNRHIYIKNDTHLDVDGHAVVAREIVERLGMPATGLLSDATRSPSDTTGR